MKVEIKNFTKEELACPCCGENKIEDKALMRLQVLRDLCGFPLSISSGYRCKKHNEKIGGAKHSKHLNGVAFDVQKLSSSQRAIFFKNALNLGFSGIGVYEAHVHIDLREKTAMWL